MDIPGFYLSTGLVNFNRVVGVTLDIGQDMDADTFFDRTRHSMSMSLDMDNGHAIRLSMSMS